MNDLCISEPRSFQTNREVGEGRQGKTVCEVASVCAKKKKSCIYFHSSDCSDCMNNRNSSDCSDFSYSRLEGMQM